MGSHDLRKCMCIGCIAEMTNAENACQGISDAAPDLLGLKFYEIKEAMESSCPAGRIIRWEGIKTNSTWKPTTCKISWVNCNWSHLQISCHFSFFSVIVISSENSFSFMCKAICSLKWDSFYKCTQACSEVFVEYQKQIDCVCTRCRTKLTEVRKMCQGVKGMNATSLRVIDKEIKESVTRCPASKLIYNSVCC